MVDKWSVVSRKLLVARRLGVEGRVSARVVLEAADIVVRVVDNFKVAAAKEEGDCVDVATETTVVAVDVDAIDCIDVNAPGKVPSCIKHCSCGTHLVTSCGPSCNVQQTPGGSAVAQSFTPSMEVRHFEFVLIGTVATSTDEGVRVVDANTPLLEVRPVRVVVVVVVDVVVVLAVVVIVVDEATFVSWLMLEVSDTSIDVGM